MSFPVTLISPAVTLILPAYNEAAIIEQTIRRASAYFHDRGLEHEIIVSADGRDRTREIASSLISSIPSLKVIGSVERRGKGLGIREAVTLARGGIIGFADADEKTPIEEFDKFFPLVTGDWDVVIGSRAAPHSRIERVQPWYRRLGSKGFALAMHTITGLHDIQDTQCGFKFFKRGVALDLFSRQRIDGYMFDVEILYLARQSGFRILEVPIKWRDDADSRLDLVSGNIRNAVDLLRIRTMRYGPSVRQPQASPAHLVQGDSAPSRIKH